jgi:APA family basic amino acid/polyamine antiporter
LCHGELAGMMPKAGGQFVYIQSLRKVSFSLWLDRFTVIQTGVIAAIAATFQPRSYIFPSIRHRPFKWGMVLCFHTKSFGCFKYHLPLISIHKELKAEKWYQY